MKLKPIIHFHNGKMNVIAKVRHTQNALEYLSDEVRKRLESSQKAKLFRLYAGDQALYQEFERHIRHQTNELIYAYPISPVVGAHIGLKAVGIGMWLES
ncbi:EDD domain protein, DegV family [Suttonella ornithocola]|uniref:EDD domain protein, DegV family n=2 Tax=Suttonella ornithocola TaxID=279832 RepID=A0A380MLB9_9GAMM|nr:EDD domain protein, DegV family [Suttonella ornithocola]